MNRTSEAESLERIERELSPHAVPGDAEGTSRRTFIAGAAAAAAAGTLLSSSPASALGAKDGSLAAAPPSGFTPFAAPGKIVRVSKKDSLEANGRYPKADDAKAMLEKALMELTGKPNVVEAVKQFVHSDDKVVVKVNGIALQNMGTNKELVLPFLEAMIEGGVPAQNITVLEQYGGFLNGTRVNEVNRFRRLIAEGRVDSEVTLELLRDGQVMQIKVRLAQRLDDVASIPEEPVRTREEPEDTEWLGAQLATLTEKLAEQLEIRYQPGVAVMDVAEGSPADDAGLTQGDVIVEINAKPARTIEDCENRLKENGSGERPLLLLVSSGGSVRYVAVRPPRS